jgi:hypothetical protein
LAEALDGWIPWTIGLRGAEGKATFETTARALIDRWTAEREFHVSPAEIERAREYLGRVGIRAAERADGSFLLERTGRTVSRVQLVVLGLRLLAERTSWDGGRRR